RYELPPHAVLLEDAAPSGRFNRRTESRSPSFIPDEIPRLGEYPCLISCGGLEEQLKVLGQTSLGELKKRAAERIGVRQFGPMGYRDGEGIGEDLGPNLVLDPRRIRSKGDVE